jgi:hypothetical protein
MGNLLIYSAVGNFCIWQRVVPLFRPYLAWQNWVNNSSVNLLH